MSFDHLGFPAKLLLTLTGGKGAEVLEVQDVSLVEVSGFGVSKGTVEKMSDGNILVTVTEVPEEFVVLLKGKDMTSNSLFQRQTTTQMSQSKLTIKVQTVSFVCTSYFYNNILFADIVI